MEKKLDITNLIIYSVLGLCFSAFYFYQNFKNDKTFVDNWKQLFSDFEGQRMFYTHIISYFLILTLWYMYGGSAFVYTILIVLKFILETVLSIVSIKVDLQPIVLQICNSFEYVMPKGQLTIFTAFWGFFMTSFIRNWLPQILKLIKGFFLAIAEFIKSKFK